MLYGEYAHFFLCTKRDMTEKGLLNEDYYIEYLKIILRYRRTLDGYPD